MIIQTFLDPITALTWFGSAKACMHWVQQDELTTAICTADQFKDMLCAINAKVMNQWAAGIPASQEQVIGLRSALLAFQQLSAYESLRHRHYFVLRLSPHEYCLRRGFDNAIRETGQRRVEWEAALENTRRTFCTAESGQGASPYSPVDHFLYPEYRQWHGEFLSWAATRCPTFAQLVTPESMGRIVTTF